MTRDTKTVEAHRPLHPVAFEILFGLWSGPTHAYAVVRAIEARHPTWYPLQPTNMYRRVWRLVDDGLVTQVRAPDPEADVRRKYFAITPQGREVVATEVARMRDVVQVAAELGVGPAHAMPR